MITFSQLANSLALQEHGNFRRAAEAQHLSQPAFSRSIQKLEASLGVTLFDRLTSGAEATIYGEVLLQRADAILLEALEIERETQLLKKLEIGSISVAMGFFAAEISGRKAIARMVDLHPELRCQVTVDDWRVVGEMVLDRRVDIGFAGINHLIEHKELQVIPVGQHELVCFCRSGHPLLELENISKSDLDAYPVVTVRVPPEMASVFPGKSYVDKSSGDLTPSIRAGDQATAREIVSGSNAFSLATPVQIEPWLHSGEFKILDFREPWMIASYGFIFRQNRMLVPMAEAFMQHVREVETEMTKRNQSLLKKLLSGMGRSGNANQTGDQA